MLVYITRAFCRNGQGGNLAGVILLEEPLSVEKMQHLAQMLNFSETVFLSKISQSGYKALYFTPNSSIDFCGHASIAAFGVLKQLGEVSDGIYQLDTPAGSFEIALTGRSIYLSQLLPHFEEEISEEEIAEVLGIPAEEIQATQLKPQIVSTGLRDIIVPLISREVLFALTPDFDSMIRLSEKYSIVGLHVFSLDSFNSSVTAHCRNFAPLYGIPEESATGSSNGALACYLFQKGLLSSVELLFKQGDILNLPSDIHVRLSLRENEILKVECGGEVVIDSKKTLALPVTIDF